MTTDSDVETVVVHSVERDMHGSEVEDSDHAIAVPKPYAEDKDMTVITEDDTLWQPQFADLDLYERSYF